VRRRRRRRRRRTTTTTTTTMIKAWLLHSTLVEICGRVEVKSEQPA
jgi:hypothetical protein